MSKAKQLTDTLFVLPIGRSAFFKMDSALKKARQMLDKRFEEATIDLTVDQWILIECLFVHKKLSQHQLAKLSDKDPATITRILDITCKKNLTVRIPSPTDRRSFDILLTSYGKDAFAKAQKQAIYVREKGFGRFSKGEYLKFCTLLDKISQDLN